MKVDLSSGWRRDLSHAVRANVENRRLQMLVQSTTKAELRDACETWWRSTVRYEYRGAAHRISHWNECIRRGGACADAAAFVAACALLAGDGDDAFVCTEEAENYYHARTTWGHRLVDPTADRSRPVLGGCHRVATAAQLLRGHA